ncbi:MAG: hypothetical protein V4579_03030 [Pseudomonadota bacterium]
MNDARSTSGDRLPPAFAELQGFVDHWARATTNKRVAARSVLSQSDIRTFYDAMVPRLNEAIDYIDSVGLHSLTPEAETLTRLVLGLGQASIAIEIHGAPIKPGTVFPHGIHVDRGPVPFG